MALGEKLPGGRLMARARVELELDLAVPVEPEPPERPLDLFDRLLDLAARVRVLDPKEKLAALVAREEPVEERRADAADVEESGRAGCETSADGHPVIVLVCPKGKRPLPMRTHRGCGSLVGR
jgi:hypothetical protein